MVLHSYNNRKKYVMLHYKYKKNRNNIVKGKSGDIEMKTRSKQVEVLYVVRSNRSRDRMKSRA